MMKECIFVGSDTRKLMDRKFENSLPDAETEALIAFKAVIKVLSTQTRHREQDNGIVRGRMV